MGRALRIGSLGTILTVAALISGCSTGHVSGIEPAAATGFITPGLVLDPPVDHVHAAVVHDSVLLLGTHSGLFEVDLGTGQTSRRGTTQDDLMGLATDGSSLVASGHPGPETDLPDPLGLLRSDDKGQTWRSISLLGEVDFHGLAVAGSSVAGIGTQDGVLVSRNGGSSWSRADIEDATSLAWFQGALWVASESGLRIWRSGVITDAPASEQTMLALAAADDGSALWAISLDGTVWRTADGSTWEKRGAITSLEALAATSDAAYVITADAVAVIAGR